MAMKRARTAGFTLVELMIAMIAGAFAVAGVYYLNGVSSRTFSEQLRVSETQMSLRSAMEQLRREFARSGYLYTSSSRVNPDCSGSYPVAEPNDIVGTRTAMLQAISITSDGSLAAVNSLLGSPATNRTRADSVDVWGNYATSDAYLADPITTTNNAIVFQTNSESFRRSFVNPTTESIDANRFTQTFAPGRMVRVEHDGRVFFRDIVSVTATPPTYQINIGALPWCFEPTRWTAVAPIVHYRYALEPDTAADLSRLRPKDAASTAIGSSRALLVRREWRTTGGVDAVVANSARVMLDNAVEFSVEAQVDSNAALPPAIAQTPSYALVRGANLATQSANAPWQFRALIVTLTARSAEADPRLPTIARAPFGDANLLDGPMMTFRVIGGNVNAAATLNTRVRTMRSEIFLQNL